MKGTVSINRSFTEIIGLNIDTENKIVYVNCGEKSGQCDVADAVKNIAGGLSNTAVVDSFFRECAKLALVLADKDITAVKK